MSSPKVSVIIPVYNSEKHLKRCLDSVINQTLRDIEIICVDDGSTDNSLDILKEYESTDQRIKVLSQPNINAGAARNHGLRYAKGEYLSFLDSDDFFSFNMLETAYRKAIEFNAEIVVFRSDFYFEDNNRFESAPWTIRNELLPDKEPFAGTDIKKDALKLFLGWAWDKLFLRSFICEQDLHFQEQRTSNDLTFVFTAVLTAHRIVTIEDILAHQRRRFNSSLSVTREKSWDCFYQALKELKVQLQKRDVFVRFEQDYENYCINFSLWNLRTLKWPMQELCFYCLKGSWFQILGVTEHNESFYYNKDEYFQYLNIMKHSYREVFPEEKPASIRTHKDLSKKNTVPLKKVLSTLIGGAECFRKHGFKYTLSQIELYLHNKRSQK